MDSQSIVFNGINGATGKYLISLTPAEIADLARAEPRDKAHLNALRRRKAQAEETTFAVVPWVKIDDLASAGWGIVFPATSDRAEQQKWEDIESELSPLIEHRRQQATKEKEQRFRVFNGPNGYRGPIDGEPGESALQFLLRHGAGPGEADPDVVPYYLLLVGCPEQIPFNFQYQLDVQYAVGRLCFGTPEEYRNYARSVVTAESAGPRPRQAAFVGVKNADDPATNLSAASLVSPLVDKLGAVSPEWRGKLRQVVGEDAKKRPLQDLFGGDRTPTFLFTASHGMGFPANDPRQSTDQGALLCQDWPGPVMWGDREISEDFYLASGDIGPEASLLGTIAFHFACYGAGTPSRNDFAHLMVKEPLELAAQPFVAALPQRLLGHPNGGALAIIGHVERAWGYSVAWDGNPQLITFVSTIQSILDGKPVGAALDYFNLRYATLSSELVEQWKEERAGGVIDDLYVTRVWTAGNDARSYVVLGDPAVRINAGDIPDDTPRLELKPTHHSPTIQDDRSNRESSAAIADSGQYAERVEEGPESHRTASSINAAESAEVESFAIFGRDSALKRAAEQLAATVEDFADKLGEALQRAIDNATTLTVQTYVSDDLTAIGDDGTVFTGPAVLLVVTDMKLAGDTRVCVQRHTADLKNGIWPIHADMVQRAQTNRVELLKAAVSAAAGLIEAARG